MLIGTISLCFYFIFLIYAYRTFNYSLLLRNPVSGSPLGFLEAGHILICSNTVVKKYFLN